MKSQKEFNEHVSFDYNSGNINSIVPLNGNNYFWLKRWKNEAGVDACGKKVRGSYVIFFESRQVCEGAWFRARKEEEAVN